MEYRVEIEFSSNGGRIIRYYYWCPRCGYRLNDMVITVGRDSGKVRIVLEQYVLRRSIKR
jgi:C4-type Zn-finger protein